MDLLKFQIDAATEIASKFKNYYQDPLLISRTRILPFYQNLSAITGAGKTLILADSIEQIRSQLPIQPIILWLSKGKVVVWQTYQNLSTGKYAGLLGGYVVKPLLDCTPADVEDTHKGLVLVATVGKFNQKDKEQGDRKIFRAELDVADESLWELLKARRDRGEKKRKLIVVYDEGHNLSDQQTQLLSDLNPEAIIAASATMRVPEAINPTLERLRREKSWKDKDFVTTVMSSDVVTSGLIKGHIQLGGYVTPMEIAINDLLDDMARVERATHEYNLPFTPKAIYVSNTNVVPTAKQEDTTNTPFDQRQARPIVIWRHLVEQGIDPTTIAVYCNLKFNQKYPPPLEFKVFAGGDSDYDEFIAGDFKHIIFNLTLQEGWDDPTCYFCYIDKDMGARDQITQIIGRVLRQPGAQHYQEPALNTAHFYIRTDEKTVFEQVLREVEAKIAVNSPEITLSVYRAGASGGKKPIIALKKQKFVPEVGINSKDAREPIRQIVGRIPDYREDRINTVGKGERISVLQTIGSGKSAVEEWVEVEHSNKVTARWVFVREVQKNYGKAVNLCDIEEKKFDAMVEYNSVAAEQMREAAMKVVDAYLEHSEVIQSYAKTTEVPDVAVNTSEMIKYKNAVHEGYSGLNELEKEFAAAIDKTRRVWMRNPSRGFFEIPLLDKGATKNFNPDFLVWTDNALVAIDPKADHLIREDAARKLFYIKKIGAGLDLAIRLVTRGKWNDEMRILKTNGFSVWMLRNGKVHPVHEDSVERAVQLCLSGNKNTVESGLESYTPV